MSLGLVIKGPEGIVLAADSRVTLEIQSPGSTAVVSAFYDTATKLLKVAGQNFVGAVTFGVGAIGSAQPRTASSFLPEFEKELGDNAPRLSVEQFATRLGQFFLSQWNSRMPAQFSRGNMTFIVGGYNEDEPYGRVYQLSVPTNPTPVELYPDAFGITFGGQAEITARILNSVDFPTINQIAQRFNLDREGSGQLLQQLRVRNSLKIPYQFISLQDSVDLAILLIKTTAQLMKFVTDMRGVGGPADVATTTRIDGFRYVQHKQIRGERNDQ